MSALTKSTGNLFIYSGSGKLARTSKISVKSEGQLFRGGNRQDSGHSFSLIACTRPSGPHVRNNGYSAWVCMCVGASQPSQAEPSQTGRPSAAQRSGSQVSTAPSAPCYLQLLISPKPVREKLPSARRHCRRRNYARLEHTSVTQASTSFEASCLIRSISMKTHAHKSLKARANPMQKPMYPDASRVSSQGRN